MSWGDVSVFAAVPFTLTAVWWIFRRPHGTSNTLILSNIKRLWADRHGLSESPGTLYRGRRGAYLALATVCALLALARPQWGTVEETTFDQAREVVIALDLSRSMLADDVKPTRLARAKLLIESLLYQLKGERVGLVVFAGTAFVQSPLSADYEVMRDLLKDLDPSYLPQGGTNYGSMLEAAAKAFGETGDGDRFLVVLSDGEAHDEEWQSQVASLRERGVRVIGLGVGTAEGALLPDEKGGLLKDDTGGVVLSRLEPRTLQQLSEQTQGTYRDASTWVDIADLVRGTVDQGVKGQYLEQKQAHQQDRFQWFLAPALLFFLLSYWIELPVFPVARTLKRSPRRQQSSAAPTARAAAVLLVAVLAPRFAGATAAVQPNALETTVADLVAKPAVAPGDYARLAQQTIDFASKPDAPAGPARIGVIDDGLAGVTRGEAADAHAADWPTLRKQLEQLKQAAQRPPHDQPPKQDQQQQRDQQNSQQGGQERQDQNGDQSGQDRQQHGSAGADKNDQHTQNEPSENHDAGGSKAEDNAQNAHDAQDESQKRPQSQSKTRTIGGGSGRREAVQEGDPGLAEAVGKMERIKDADAPAVLFERMSQAEKPQPPRPTGKNW